MKLTFDLSETEMLDQHIHALCSRIIDNRLRSLMVETAKSKTRKHRIGRHRRYSKADALKMRLMYEQGMTYRKIAEKFKCSENAVWLYLKVYDINDLS